jgi:RNA polymerase sigma-70 factor (ECF subfamily)
MDPCGDSVADLASLGKLFEEHRVRLLAMLRQRIDPRLQARVDAEEILQEAFLAARGKWGRSHPEADVSPYAWLYRVTLDTLIEAWRRHTRECRDPRADLPWPEQSSIQLGLELVHGGTSPSEAFARAEDREQVRLALSRLRPADREILWMRHFDGLSFVEAASILGISANAATVRYVRAIQRLRDEWNMPGGMPPGERG